MFAPKKIAPVNVGDRRILEAFDSIGAPMLILNGQSEVEHANRQAVELFAPVFPEGFALPSLCRQVGLDPLSTASPSEGERHFSERTQMRDGRVFQCTSTRLRGGWSVLILHDVTGYATDAEQALFDPLTGLHNRTSLKRQLVNAVSGAGHLHRSCAIHLIDLDRFKTVNDTLGHPTGDLLLQKVADRLRSAVQEGEIVARLGGDEFAILQVDIVHADTAKILAARVVDLLGRTYLINGHMLNIGASVGVTLAPQDSRDPDQLLKHADLALYRAKQDGRGAFCFFEPAMDARMQARRLLENDLRKALALKELSLAYQPQVMVSTREIVGFEALLRWQHPERGYVSPAEFIPLAEEIGLINQIGDWVLRTACREAATWAQPVTVAVNISAVQFRTGKLAETTISALSQSGLDPHRLELEITEGALLEDTENVLSTLNRVRALGVKISMDDFGTGYSSLSYLQKFPFNKIKIDQSFIRGSKAGESSSAIVRAVSNLGVSLGMRTIAEGVETEEQLARIHADGCLEVQGYLTGRPVSPDAVPALLQTTDPRS
jgi:diguanylate cyclase (GGDEF)-like protein